MKKAELLDRIVANKGKINDWVYTIAALVLYNGITQLVVYPLLNRRLGDDYFGLVLSSLAFIAIVAGAGGQSIASARLKAKVEMSPSNGDFNRILVIVGIGCIIASLSYLHMQGISGIANVFLYGFLMIITMLRYYSDVEFRLQLNFKKYFVYYALVALGYIIGVALFKIVPQYMLVFIIGELMAVGYVLTRGVIYKPPFFKITQWKPLINRSVAYLLLTGLLATLIANVDRLLIMQILGGEAVTVYYAAAVTAKMLMMITAPMNIVILSYLVNYEGKLSEFIFKKIFKALVLILSIVSVACIIISPLVIGMLYPTVLDRSSEIVFAVTVGQITFIGVNVLMTVYIRFYDEKYQMYVLSAYAVVYVFAGFIALLFSGLERFTITISIINILTLCFVGLFGLYKTRESDKNKVREDEGER